MNTCSQCNYWQPEAPVAKGKADMGECNKLSYPESTIKEDYLLPVLSDEDMAKVKGAEFLTKASFGCNQFAQA